MKFSNLQGIVHKIRFFTVEIGFSERQTHLSVDAGIWLSGHTQTIYCLVFNISNNKDNFFVRVILWRRNPTLARRTAFKKALKALTGEVQEEPCPELKNADHTVQLLESRCNAVRVLDKTITDAELDDQPENWEDVTLIIEPSRLTRLYGVYDVPNIEIPIGRDVFLEIREDWRDHFSESPDATTTTLQ